jgi:pyrimidine-nucleoside phosphorylase
MPIHPIDVIQHKRDGLTLSDAEIQSFLHALVHRTPENPTPTDAQAAAFLMAVFLRGLSAQELAALTQAMRFSGETLDTSSLGSFVVDKHSTGGVGDKTSLLIAPIVAAAGLGVRNQTGGPGICVPMISGRSLGHTGGTLDKLETIPGFNTQLALPRVLEVLRTCGAALIGQTPTLVPADRILYALRDHTGTVESPYLITASIMSKKLAEGLNGLVLDVKTGSGAFMKKYDDARLLANLMVQTGELAGTRTVALLTDMSQPLGRFAGNWVEVQECIEIMSTTDPNRRHPLSRDLIDLTNALAGWMLHLSGHAASPEAGAKVSDDILLSGHAFNAFHAIVQAQGGDTAVLSQTAGIHQPTATRTLTAAHSGYLSQMDCTQIGWAVQRLGAGRARPGDPVSAHAGIEMHAKLGDRLEANQPLVTLFAEDPALLDEPYQMLQETLQISAIPPAPTPLIREVIQNEH